MQSLFPLLLALLASVAFAQTPQSHAMPKDTLPTAILIDESPSPQTAAVCCCKPKPHQAQNATICACAA
ncbi:hypothetical protein [Kingella oralis]|uniref:hypothetical protein n=1 Tax=Kingella oralis TaxID=505 RepID=UPI002D80E793|nr:hypothetical protein [Kingella oralis]